jgi:hypothetical protein
MPGDSSRELLPHEPSREDTWEALRRRARQAQSRSARVRAEHRDVLRAGQARRDHDPTVERALALLAHTGDHGARNALVRRLVPAVRALARDSRTANPNDRGLAALREAVDTWEPVAGMPVRDYALERVRAIL